MTSLRDGPHDVLPLVSIVTRGHTMPVTLPCLGSANLKHCSTCTWPVAVFSFVHSVITWTSKKWSVIRISARI